MHDGLLQDLARALYAPGVIFIGHHRGAFHALLTSLFEPLEAGPAPEVPAEFQYMPRDSADSVVYYLIFPVQAGLRRHHIQVQPGPQRRHKSPVVLDPVYTGKAMYGLVDQIKNGRFTKEMNLLFIHTGGIFGLFPKRHIFVGGADTGEFYESKNH